MAAAVMRAAHLLLDDQPWVLKDHLAARLIGIEDDEALREAVRAFEAGFSKDAPVSAVRAFISAARAGVIARARFAEDELLSAVGRGVRQYVILGAGFDSFAYRNADGQPNLRVYEMDFPATQERKRERLREMKISAPGSLTYVPIDFESESILSALQRLGYRAEEPAFFSWLGVSFYLSESAVVGTLTEIARAASGSELVFDYLVPPSHLDEDVRRIRQLTSERWAADRGEPRRSDFEPGLLAAKLRELGFSETEDLGPEAVNRRYFSRRTDGLQFGSHMHLMRARI